MTSLVATAAEISSADAATLAPTGTLRAAILGDNPALGHVDPQTGLVVGPVADLIKEWARRLGVPYVIIRATGAPDIMARLKAHTADAGFMAPNAARAQEVDFAAPWMLMPNSHLVATKSPLQKVADADQPGILIGTAKNDTQDVYLTAHLKSAQIKRLDGVPPPAEVKRLLVDGEIASLAANRQRLLDIAALYPTDLRVLPDNFSVAPQAIAVPKGDPAKVDAANRFLSDLLTTSFVKDSIDRTGLKGVFAAEAQKR